MWWVRGSGSKRSGGGGNLQFKKKKKGGKKLVVMVLIIYLSDVPVFVLLPSHPIPFHSIPCPNPNLIKEGKKKGKEKKRISRSAHDGNEQRTW